MSNRLFAPREPVSPFWKAAAALGVFLGFVVVGLLVLILFFPSVVRRAAHLSSNPPQARALVAVQPPAVVRTGASGEVLARECAARALALPDIHRAVLQNPDLADLPAEVREGIEAGLIAHVSAEVPPHTSLLSFEVRGCERYDEAVKIARAVAQAVVEYENQRIAAALDADLARLTEEAQQIEARLSEAAKIASGELEPPGGAEAGTVAGLDQQVAALSSRRQRLEVALAEAELAQGRAQSAWEPVRDLTPENLEALPEVVLRVEADDALQRLRTSLSNTRIELEQVRKETGPTSSTARSLELRIPAVEAEIERRRRQLVPPAIAALKGSRQQELESARAAVAKVRSELDETRQRLNEAVMTLASARTQREAAMRSALHGRGAAQQEELLLRERLEEILAALARLELQKKDYVPLTLVGAGSLEHAPPPR